MYGICGKAIDKCARIVYNNSVKYHTIREKGRFPREAMVT